MPRCKLNLSCHEEWFSYPTHFINILPFFAIIYKLYYKLFLYVTHLRCFLYTKYHYIRNFVKKTFKKWPPEDTRGWTDLSPCVTGGDGNLVTRHVRRLRRFNNRASGWNSALNPRDRCFFGKTVETVAWLQHAKNIIRDKKWYFHIWEPFFSGLT